MSRLMHKLKDANVRQVKPNPLKNIILPDGAGLRLVVTPAGRKHFEFKSAAGGTERTVRLGQYPDMGLDGARKEAAKLRLLVKEGRNPTAEKKVERLRARTAAGTTFEKVSEELLEGKKKNISESYFKRMHAAIRANLYPLLGDLPIQTVDALALREALRRVEARGALDMLSDLRRWSSEIFDFAKANGAYVGDNPADALIRNVFKKHTGENRRALSWPAMGAFWRALDAMTGDRATVAAIRLIVLTAARPGEVRMARWDEFDMGAKRWTVPVERMKMRKPHSVPLSSQAIELLESLKVLTGHSDYLFPARSRGGKSPVISDMGILKAVKRAAGVDIHAHGFRSVFSTHVAESGLWPDVVKEAALAHGKRGVEGVYDRATHYPERVKLMQWYADEIDKVARGAEVIPLQEVA
jgi:integrase